MIKKIKWFSFVLVVFTLFAYAGVQRENKLISYANDESVDCYKIYDAENEEKLLFMRGSDVYVGDEYISADNKLYILEEVDGETLTGKARYVENVKMPVYNIKRSAEIATVNAENVKKVGLYHTHNDECYNNADGTDSVYGKGGIHDVGAKFKANLENLGIEVMYNETLHLPHDSGAYTRSNATAGLLLDSGAVAIFDAHRDATPRSEYITEVNGETMSKVRMVVGSANANSAVNKEFALNIKAYADEVYPGLIKDIYVGKGNYNQQLSSRAMLFEFGTNTIEKAYVLKSTLPLAKTIDVVLFGTNGANNESLKDIDTEVSSGDVLEAGLTGTTSTARNDSPAGISTLAVILIILSSVALIFGLIMVISKKARRTVTKFFKELFGIGKRSHIN